VPQATLDVIQTFTIIDCCTCGISFGFTRQFERERRRDHKWFYCPNGHQQHWSQKSDVEKAREDAERQRQRAERLARDLESKSITLARERRSHSATKGQLTKVKKRADHALCPVDGCRRSFANVARHIERQHPGYKAEA
jgi:hypothetical protein